MPKIKVFDDVNNTVFDILDAADKTHRSHFLRPHRYLPVQASSRPVQALREVLSCALGAHNLFFDRSAKWLNQIEAKKTDIADQGWLVSINVVKFFRLPGDNPDKELKELRALFEAMKPFFIENANQTRPGAIRILNERDSRGRVYGDFCFIGGGAEPPNLKAELQERIKASPVLTAFMRNCGLALGKVGRYSWSDLREPALFDSDQLPWSEVHFRKLLEKKSA